MRAGAQDYLVKGEINGRMLVRSTRYASERKQAYEELSRLACQGFILTVILRPVFEAKKRFDLSA